MVDSISSKSNSLLKTVRSLNTKKGRDESNSFLVEGLLHVGEAFEAEWDISTLIYCPQLLISEFGIHLVTKIQDKQIKCVPVTPEAFSSIAEKENPQGILAVVSQKKLELPDHLPFSFSIALVSPQDPGNVGTILRTIDAAGADSLILLDGGVDPYHPSVIRASMGSIFWKPFYSIKFTDFSSWSLKNKIRIIGTSAHSTQDYREIKLDSRPTLLLLGSEQKGLLPEQLKICDDLVSLPMMGRATSLNLAVAAGIFMYKLKE